MVEGDYDLIGVFDLVVTSTATLLSLRFEIPFKVALRVMSAAVAGVELSALLRLPILKRIFYDTFLNLLLIIEESGLRFAHKLRIQ